MLHSQSVTVAESGEEEDKKLQLMGGTMKAHNVHIKTWAPKTIRVTEDGTPEKGGVSKVDENSKTN